MGGVSRFSGFSTIGKSLGEKSLRFCINFFSVHSFSFFLSLLVCGLLRDTSSFIMSLNEIFVHIAVVFEE